MPIHFRETSTDSGDREGVGSTEQFDRSRDGAESPFDRAARAEEWRAAQAVLLQLPLDERRVLVAHETIGVPAYVERSGVPKNRAYQLLRQARARIAEIVGEPGAFATV